MTISESGDNLCTAPRNMLALYKQQEIDVKKINKRT